mgnify:FL=1|tara:strand:- start:310 stop:699 length:390 start_codon:yes stop_codon:yes gene_type:complete
MPAKSTSTAVNSAKKVTTTKRKTRTRKASTKVTQSPKKVSLNTPKSAPVVVKEVSKVETKSVKNVQRRRPVKTHLTAQDYVTDFKVRWEIHSFEIQELNTDLVAIYQSASKIAVDVVNYIKTSYNTAFN